MGRQKPPQGEVPSLIQPANDTSMLISHEAIYQALYVQGRGALRRELVPCLRTGWMLQVPRATGVSEILCVSRLINSLAQHESFCELDGQLRLGSMP